MGEEGFESVFFQESERFQQASYREEREKKNQGDPLLGDIHFSMEEVRYFFERGGWEA